eukprot:5129813-Ditylum_brightwellii.AAC.1
MEQGIELEDRLNVDKLERRVIREEDDFNRELGTRKAVMKGKAKRRVVLTELNMFYEQNKAADKEVKKRKKAQRKRQSDPSNKRS